MRDPKAIQTRPRIGAPSLRDENDVPEAAPMPSCPRCLHQETTTTTASGYLIGVCAKCRHRWRTSMMRSNERRMVKVASAKGAYVEERIQPRLRPCTEEEAIGTPPVDVTRYVEVE